MNVTEKSTKKSKIECIREPWLVQIAMRWGQAILENRVTSHPGKLENLEKKRLVSQVFHGKPGTLYHFFVFYPGKRGNSLFLCFAQIEKLFLFNHLRIAIVYSG